MAGEALRVVNGAGAGAQIPLYGEFVVGRSEAGAGNLTGDSEISRRHARFQVTQYGQVILEDLGSTNGTYVNGERLAAPRVLAPGDQITMGRTIVQFEAAGGVQPVVPGPAVGGPPVAAPPVGAPPAPAAFAVPPPLEPAAYGAGQAGGAPVASSSRPAWLLPLGIAVAVLAVVGAIVAVATNSGSDSGTNAVAPVSQAATQPGATTPAQSTPAPASAVRSVPALEASLKSVLNGASTSGPSVTTVTCPPNAPSAAGSTFACAVRGGQGLGGTVTVTLKDSQRKTYKFKAMLQGNGFTRTVSGTAG
jgi:predicted component of type VI protein secretion system